MASYERVTLDEIDVAADPGYSYDTPGPFPHPRPAFRRESSSFGLTSPDRNVTFHTSNPAAMDEAGETKDGGLGISYDRIKRVPVGSKETMNSTYSSPEVASGRTSQATTYHNTPSGNSQVYVDSPDTQMLKGPFTGTGGLDCPTHKNILDPKLSWLTISIMILAVYSTVFSGLYLVIAMWKPRWGQNIGTQGHISFSTASLLSALFAKTIELSFVTVFVTFLGQALSRRAFTKSITVGGISIADMTMRTWVMQPGTLITHWEAVRYSGTTILGGITLLAAFAAIFYTTAAEALVAPKLKDASTHTSTLEGLTYMSFANAPYLEATCQTPVKRTNVNPDDEGATCLQIEHAGQSWHNFKSYLDVWTESNSVGNLTNTTSYDTRPPPTAMLFDNTTVAGQWILAEDPSIASKREGRMVQRLAVAMPHANVFNAARNPVNGILQPNDLEGAGEYTITASVPSPAANILCVGLTEDELQPLIYTAWPNLTDPNGANNTLDSSNWATVLQTELQPSWFAASNSTVVDHIFGFNQSVSGPNIQGISTIQYAPIFPKYPIDHNTIIGFWQQYGQLSVYIVAKPPVVSYPATDEYVICSINAMVYNNCSTQYHAEESGGHLSVHCDDDPQNTLSYMRSQPHLPNLEPLHSVFSPDWRDIATEWINSISLNEGIMDGNASGARMLTQMIPPDTDGVMTLLYNMPSIGEALGVLAGCTLLLASSLAPFVHYWNYAEPYLADPQSETFNATVISRSYSSGGTQQWQGMFYVVLVAVFVMNVLCLLYLCRYYWRDGQVTDFTEPQNLFALAVNSPPSQTLAGSCGAGPEGDTFARRWQVGMQRDEARGTGAHPHFFVRFPDDEWASSASPTIRRGGAKKRAKVRRMEGFDVDESPAVEQYTRLSDKWGSIL